MAYTLSLFWNPDLGKVRKAPYHVVPVSVDAGVGRCRCLFVPSAIYHVRIDVSHSPRSHFILFGELSAEHRKNLLVLDPKCCLPSRNNQLF
jgi:hypothetical protein